MYVVGDEGLYVVYFFFVVVVFVGYQYCVDGLFFCQFGNGVGQLDMVLCVWFGMFQFGLDIC